MPKNANCQEKGDLKYRDLTLTLPKDGKAVIGKIPWTSHKLKWPEKYYIALSDCENNFADIQDVSV